MMSEFKQKSPLVQALVVDEDNYKEIKGMLGKDYPPPMMMKDGGVDFWTPSGILRGRPGDFLVKFPDASVAIYRAEAFADAFEVTPKTDKTGSRAFAEAETKRDAVKKEANSAKA
jgi:hypothetical protein